MQRKPPPKGEDSSPDQSAVIAFLGAPSSYTPKPATVERMDTHGAMVFLAGGQAIKIKKSVCFSYMDFSTPGKRRAAILREYKINKPHAPGLYVSVRPITLEPSGAFAFDGVGEPVEWALIMRRFKQSRLLSAMADAGALDLDLMTRLAKTVAGSHKKAVAYYDADPLNDLKQYVNDNADARDSNPELFAKTRRQSLLARIHGALNAQASLINSRLQQGYIRRCHGDLHLRNIVMLEGNPVLFDAIEFDERIATVDILDDLAFLLMDLMERGFKPLANHVLNVWLGAMNEGAQYEALALLPLYLSTRAGIRTKVMLALMQQLEGSKAKAAGRDAISYFDAAEAFITPSKPVLAAIGGLSGSGKSTLARRISPYIGAAPGAVHLRSDVIRKTLIGVDETVRLPDEAYSQARTKQVYGIILKRAKAALEAGHSVVADAVYAQQAERGEIENLARQLKVRFHGLWLDTDPDTLLRRVNARRGDASDADAGIVARQLEYDTGKIDWEKIDAAENAQTLADQVLQLVTGSGAE